MKRILYFAAALVLGLTSCSQDLEQNPPFNYPANTPPTPIPFPENCILRMSFEETLAIESSLEMEPRMTGGAAVYTEGKRGMGYQGADKKALLINLSEAAKAKMMNLGSFTLTMWINFNGSNKNASALFSIAHPSYEVADLSFFMEGHGDKLENTDTFYFKGYFNTTEDKWFDRGDASKITSGIKDKWAQMGLTYDAKTSTAALYYNGTKLTTATFENYGALAFKDVSGIVLGAFPSMVGLSSATSGWPAKGSFFTGKIDELYLYGAALSDTEMTKQYQDQM